MKANINALHAKLYNFTYRSDLPNNLCPYFWKLVWATILFIPILILQLPTYLGDLIVKEENRDWRRDGRKNWGLGLWLIITFVIFIIIGNYHWIKALMNCYSYNRDWANWGWLIDGTILSIFIGVKIAIYIRKVQEKKWNKPYKQKEPSIIVEFIKATYGKYCPKIEWNK